MKKIITFAIVLGILTGGIIFYSMQMQSEAVQETVLKSLPHEIYVEQGAWKDFLVPDKEAGRVYRKANHDMATIIELEDNKITVDWDRWGIETFKKDDAGTWRL